MNIDEKKALLYSSLERAAEHLGDITPQVMALYYERYPDARQRFDELNNRGRLRLEGEMVEQVLYCLMTWYDSSGGIESILVNTIPHHVDTLNVRPQLFSELITAVCDTVTVTIPLHETGELSVWRKLHETMKSLVEEGARFARSRDDQPFAT